MLGILSCDMIVKKLSCEHGELTGIAQPNAGKERILAVHGWLDNAASFIPLMQEMPEYDWFALDLSGHGQSLHRPAGYGYYFTDYLQDIKRAAAALNWSSFYLIGHSLGANLSSVYAATYPHQVKKNIMIDGFGLFAHEDKFALRTLLRAIETSEKYAHDERRVYPSLQRLIERRIAVGGMQYESARLLIEYACRAHDDGVELMSDQRLKQSSYFYFTPKQVAAIYAGIQSPNLLIRANQGLLPEREKMQLLLDAIADLQVLALDGHHHLHMDNAADVAQHISAFLRGTHA